METTLHAKRGHYNGRDIKLPFGPAHRISVLIIRYAQMPLINTHVGIPAGKVGRSKPPPVLTSGFNRLKPPWSLSQKVVNTGQYESRSSVTS